MSEFDTGSDHDREPLFRWNGYPVYSATLLVGVYVGMLLIWTLLFAASQYWLAETLSFQTLPLLRGWVWQKGWLWQPFTYPLVQLPGSFQEMVWWAVGMYFLWTFGGEVERFFGRKTFWKLYALLCLVGPIAFACLNWLQPDLLAGTHAIHLSLFIAFATIYPGARFFFGVPAKWAAVIVIAAEFIQDVAFHRITYLLMFAASIAAAHWFVRYQKGEFTLPQLRWPRRRPKLRVLPRPAPSIQRVRVTSAPVDSMDDVDALLDKIARSGMASLSPAERARLERASADLKKRPEPL